MRRRPLRKRRRARTRLDAARSDTRNGAAIIHHSYPDPYLREILRGTRTIAMVGASPHWNRPSYFVMKYAAAD
jgi:hypothetical protein